MGDMMLEGNVFITGGAGFLGRGVMRRAQREGWPVRFTIYSRDEQLQAECRVKYPDARYVLGDVRDTERLSLAMTGSDYVIHAAAMKFIPEAEFNALECVSVNVDGARSVVSAGRAAGVDRVVGISTDKAAQPVNVYGMTKALMERMFAEATVFPTPTYTTCRYGNVIGSTGSVVPVMLAQMKRQGYVEITDPNMTRFWITVDEAVDIILEAFKAPAGVTVVPTPFAARMADVAHAVVDVSGAEYRNINDDPQLIRVIGARPGEKLDEDLVGHYEGFRAFLVGQYYHIYGPGTRNEKGVTISNSHDAPMLDRHQLRKMIESSLDV
jgi:Predicted nucleoside-diphosphate sugar epimerases